MKAIETQKEKLPEATSFQKQLRKVHRLIRQNKVNEAWEVLGQISPGSLQALDEPMCSQVLETRQMIVRKMISELKEK